VRNEKGQSHECVKQHRNPIDRVFCSAQKDKMHQSGKKHYDPEQGAEGLLTEYDPRACQNHRENYNKQDYLPGVWLQLKRSVHDLPPVF